MSDRPDTSTVRVTAALVVGYVLLGAAGLLLAIPPGYASPVFPAAGLALAFVLRFGPRALPGVAAGSLLLNLGAAAHAGTLAPATALAAAGIACGATLQAAVGRALVFRFRPSALPALEREGDALAFLFLGGAVACLVAPTVAVLALSLAGVIPPSGIAATWGNWYLGDLFGVLVFAPLALCFLLAPMPPWNERRRRIVLPMALTLVLSGLGYLGAARWEQRVDDDQLESDGQVIARAIEDRLLVHREALASLRNLLESSPDLDFARFSAFARSLLAENPDLSAVSVNDVVAGPERASYEDETSRASPLGRFVITERNAAGEIVPASPRPEYVPVRFIVPLEGNTAAVGFDLLSEDRRRDAIRRARASGGMAATAPIRLVQEDQALGLLEILPFFRPAGGGARGRPGFAVGVVRVHEFVKAATEGHVPQGVAFTLRDRGAPEERRLLHASGPSPSPGRAVPTWTTVVPAGQRPWELTVQLVGEHRHPHWLAWAVGVTSLAFATVLQILLLGMTGHTALLERSGAALQASERRYRDLLQTLQAGVVVHAPDTRILISNGAASDLLGLAREQLLGLAIPDPAWQFVRADGTPMPPDEYPVARVLASGSPVVSQLVGIDRADGRGRAWVLANAFPVRGTGGVLQEVVVSFVDITERHALEERLALAGRLSALGTLVAGVAHEINNPLTGELAGQGLALEEALALRDLLRSEAPLDREGMARSLDSVVEALQDAQAGGKRIAGIVRDLSLFARPDPRRVRVELADVVDEAMRWLPAALLERADIDVEREPAGEVLAAPGQLAQVVVNLVTNAAKAIPAGRRGRVVVRLGPGEPGCGRIEVTDDGVGIAPDVMKRIFDPFFTTRRTGEGTGLGLPICHSIVTAHGGALSVTSHPGQGSTFRVDLPLAGDA
jgi:PAS domain S-box-containing protein